MTFPRLLLILKDLASTATDLSDFSTNLAPDFSTSESDNLICSQDSSALSALIHFPSFLYPVNSSCPSMIPWWNSFLNGSGFLTIPQSNSTLCQKRA